MKLSIIYGRSGSGKSEYIYRDISKNIDNEKIFLIVPEQCNLSAEKKLFEISGRDALINTEILTLSRMAYRVNQEVGDKYVHLSKTGKNMLIYDIISKEKSKLKFLGKSDKNIDTVNRLFTEFKKHNVFIDDLKNANIEDKYVDLKIKDIELLYEQYEERLESKYIDENDALNILYDNIDKVDFFDDSIIYIDEFLGFTPQEYNIFEKLLEKAKEVKVAISLDNFEIVNKENDIFYFNKKYANKLIEIAQNLGSSVEKIELKEIYRFKNEELKFLEKNLYNSRYRYEAKTSNIELFLASNPYSEIENVAIGIYNLVKKCGLRYNEIGIISENIDSYSEDAKCIFEKYDIPLFIDDKKDLNQNVLIKFIVSLLDIFSKNWKQEAVFDFLKIGLLDISEEDIYLLENYCKKWDIKYSKWNREFNYEPKNDLQDNLESLRQRIITPLWNFKNKISENRVANEISKEIYKFIIDNKVNVILDEKIKKYGSIEISNEYNTSYKILIGLLDEISEIFENEKMTFEKYKEILQVGVSSSELGMIPATQDQVVFGDTERTRSNKIKALFVVGINDGTFPKVLKQEGYLNDDDRSKLLDSGIELAKDSLDSLFEEQFNIYRSLTIAEEKLFLSYSSQDKDGSSIRPSTLVKKITRLFPNIKVKSNIINEEYEVTNEKASYEIALKNYKEYIEGNSIDDTWEDIIRYFYNKDYSKISNDLLGVEYTNQADTLTDENIDKLYGNIMKTSVSKLESYRRCPFSFHLIYGLKLKEKEELKIENMDTGSFMHEVVDIFFNEIANNNINLKDITDEEILESVNKIVKELLESSKNFVFTSSAKYRLQTNRLKQVVYKAICYIVYSLKNSDYTIFGNEIEFSSSGKYKSIIEEINNKKIEIVGKIDRVDTVKISNDQFVRIIDYKSSMKNIDMKQVESGLQIQLITYLDAFCNQTDFKASGVLYLGLIDNVVKNAKNLSEEEIEKKIRNNFKMKGLVLADINVVKAMDKTLESGFSDIIPVRVNKEGELAKNNSTITKDEFDNLRKDVRKIIKEISKEILSGNINIKPYSYKTKTGCDYCKFKTICMFNTNIKKNEYNIIK